MAGRRSRSPLGEGSHGAGEHRDRSQHLGDHRVEISVKHRKGKLELLLAPREWLARALAAYVLRALPITLAIAVLAPEVAVPHADTCSRMIVATAQSAEIEIIW